MSCSYIEVLLLSEVYKSVAAGRGCRGCGAAAHGGRPGGART